MRPAPRDERLRASSGRGRRGRLLGLALGAVTVILAGIVGIAGCSTILGDGSFTCTADLPGACPTGQHCNVPSGQCESAAGEGDATIPGDDDGSASLDSGRDAGPGTFRVYNDAAIGCIYGQTVCPNGLFCVTQADLGGLPGLCTSTCCQTSDCPLNFICAPTGTGGSYCIPNEVPPGNLPPTACCSNSQCAGSVCLFGNGGAGGTSSFGCSSGPAADDQGFECDPSAGTQECSTNYCGPTFKPSTSSDEPTSVCRHHCCTAAACGGADAGFYCHDESSGVGQGNGKDYVSVCYERHETTAYLALKNIGTTCASDGECKSGLCDDAGTGTAKCLDTCCVDTDCVGGQKCRPRNANPPFLRCVAP